ncbi:hypothetical protein CASFOL_010872 [Castilleja foliolosa]|uniref:Protein kinase domain-containing protein n=1 Tax=Castilleja foliolosa TaxID=1961234 RepID=A0ABD3DVW4_9LAMI
MSVFLVFIFSSLFFPVLGVEETGDCKPTRCSEYGPTIQFPFRDKYLHPEHCGYPGFDVFCNEENDTVLVLPFSIQFLVDQIDYVYQQVKLYDPAHCIAKKLPYLNLFSSPFHFVDGENFLHYTLFNCSAASSERHLGPVIPCLGDFRNHFVYVRSYEDVNSLPLTSCTKMHEVTFYNDQFSYFGIDDLTIIADQYCWTNETPTDAECWIRDTLICREYRDDPMITQLSLFLNWTEPACGECKTQEKTCRLNDSTTGHQVFPCEVIEESEGPSVEPVAGADAAERPSVKLVVAVALGSCLAVTILACLVLLCISFIAESAKKQNHMKIEKFLEDQRSLKPTRFTYSDLRRITLKFSEKLGEGGYGIVYKGKLSKEINVAVKVLHNSKGNGEEFVNEVSTIGRIHHVNVVRLVGFCADGLRRALVYEFLPNDSLEKFIFPSPGSEKWSLGWQKLRDIALGIAKGVNYLHKGCDQQILHFDIKPHNILLDPNFNPKICDFGLAKLCDKEQSGVTMTAARGTMGYIAPEVLSRTFGRVSYKSDVYSFGMVLLEMVGGRKNIDPNVDTSQVYFPQWVYNQLDLKFGDDFWAQIEEGEDGNIARRLTIVGLWCIQWCPADRPQMKDVIQMLEGDDESLTIPPNPFPANTNAANPVAGMILEEDIL